MPQPDVWSTIHSERKVLAGDLQPLTGDQWKTPSLCEGCDGPEVTGPILSLVMAMTGRRPHIDDLSGDGVATLRQR